MPEVIGKFNENENGFRKYILYSLEYPSEAKDNNIQGTAYAKLKLDKNGILHFESIIRGLNPYLEVEIIRVVENCPKWKTVAKNNDLPTDYFFVIPFKWTLVN